MNHKRLVS